MLDPKRVVLEKQEVLDGLGKRNQPELGAEIEAVVALDGKRKQIIGEVEKLKEERNSVSSQVAQKKKKQEDAASLIDSMKTVGEKIKQLDEHLNQVEAQLREKLLSIPNTLDPSVPAGSTEADNQVVREWGEKRAFSFPPQTHDVLGEKLGILDFQKGAEVTGTRFTFLKGLAARLDHAITQMMLHTHREKGYEDILPPFIVNRTALEGTGTLPKFEQDLFGLSGCDYFLIPTAEVPVTNYHAREVLKESDLPLCYVAYTPCFRSEAGSYGKDTKGLKRQHQFNKVELVKFVHPERSSEELEKLTLDAESILQKLGLPYRVVKLCGGDTSFSSALTYDIEVWSPATQSYMEISSCSNFKDYQARRAMIRFKGSGKPQFVHTLNGSGLAVGRTLIAVMENYQNEDGSFEIPPALKPYLF